MPALIRFHTIRPTVTYGRNSLSGMFSNAEYRRPIAPACTPVAIVIQNGPITDRR